MSRGNISLAFYYYSCISFLTIQAYILFDLLILVTYLVIFWNFSSFHR